YRGSAPLCVIMAVGVPPMPPDTRERYGPRLRYPLSPGARPYFLAAASHCGRSRAIMNSPASAETLKGNVCLCASSRSSLSLMPSRRCRSRPSMMCDAIGGVSLRFLTRLDMVPPLNTAQQFSGSGYCRPVSCLGHPEIVNASDVLDNAVVD